MLKTPGQNPPPQEVSPPEYSKTTPPEFPEPSECSELLDIVRLAGMVVDTRQDTRRIMEKVGRTGNQIELLGNALQSIQQQFAVLGPLTECFEESNRRQEQLGEEFRYRHFIEPLGRFGAMLHDDLGDAANDPQIETDRERRLIARWTDHLRGVTLSWLAVNGIEPIEVEPGTVFDAAVMLPVQKTSAPQESDVNTVAEMVRVGFRCGDRVLRPCRVRVYTRPVCSPRHNVHESQRFTSSV